MSLKDQTQIQLWVKDNQHKLVELAEKLIRIPSENRSPKGNELPVQMMLKRLVTDLGFECILYELDALTDLKTNPNFWPGRDYTDRPNLIALKAGEGLGKSLLFSVHADVVPGIAGKYQPFEAVLEEGKLYGRGSNDMKGGIAAVLMAFMFLKENGVQLCGDLKFESVVDEEMGGANGTLAARLQEIHADAVIIPEPTNLKVCSSHLGGVTWRIRVNGSGGMGFGGEQLVNPIFGISRIVRQIETIQAEMQATQRHVTASGFITKPNIVVSALQAGSFEPGMGDGVPETAVLEVWVECLPGDSLREVEKRFKQRIMELCQQPEMEKYEIEWEQITRFLHGSEAHSDLSSILTSLVHEEYGLPNEENMAPFACDAFVFNLFSPSPAIILGPAGENAHAADEYVTVDSLMKLTQIYIRAIMAWCGVKSE